ncbi:MAG TPA: SRPBCC family protein [Candidatus Limnocylindrales bacterium]|nr:SRPBCC family protein [Candidatus Limnocylindrales bacterium]
MAGWSVESTAEIEAPPADVWGWYADPGSWPEWAHSTAAAAIDGPLAVGAIVTVTPTRGPVQRVRIDAVEPERRLSTTLDLPGARMAFRYEIEPSATGCRVRHTVSMIGPLAVVYGLFMRRANARKLAAEIERLADSVRRPGDRSPDAHRPRT